MKVYNKLVRDNIPEIMVESGAKPVTRILDREEYLRELNKKLLEEVNEYLESGDILELADIEEVLQSIVLCKDTTLEEFDKIRVRKREKRGGFKKKIFLERED